jgi:hypothetical protein
MDDGLKLDEKRRLHVIAFDFNTQISVFKTQIIGEWAWIKLDIADTYSQQYGQCQYGGFIDVVQPLLRKTMLGFKNSVLNIACRLEYVDWNVGSFKETGASIGDSFSAIVPAVSFRPTPQTVLRLNYRREQRRDLLNNPASNTGGVQFGISSYF